MTQIGYYSRPFWPVYRPRTYLTSSYSGNLGFEVPTALGAKVARPDRSVVCITGDGGFMYNSQELSTAAREKINVVIVLFNDEAYGLAARFRSLEEGGVTVLDLSGLGPADGVHLFDAVHPDAPAAEVITRDLGTRLRARDITVRSARGPGGVLD